jgi:uncharacterized membrane protein (DUF2068 family)
VTVAIAAVLCAVNGLANIVPFGAGGSDIPTFVIYASIAVGVIGLVGAFGLWRVRRWGALLSAVVLVLSALLAAPGIVFAPTLALHLIASLGVLIAVVVLTLILLPSSRRAYA